MITRCKAQFGTEMCHKDFHKELTKRTLLSIVRFCGKPKQQHISLKVNRARSSSNVCLCAAAAVTIVFDVQSTHVTIHSFPSLERGIGPIKSMAQLVNGCRGMADSSRNKSLCPVAGD